MAMKALGYYVQQDGRCIYCGRKQPLQHLQLEHKTPKARGDQDDAANFQLICSSCNEKKGTLTDREFRKRYKLTSANQAKGPPEEVISRGYFNDIDKAIRTKSVAQNRKKK